MSRLREPLRARFANAGPGALLLLSVTALAAYAFLLRCLHLLDPDHYYILSADSYFFHWVSQGIMAGDPPAYPPGAEDPYVLHSGLAYPLAYLAKGASSSFSLSSADAMDLVCKFLPPFIGAVGLLVIYGAASKIYSPRVGLFSALAWAALVPAMFVGAAGYLDRDGFGILLMTAGVLLFYASQRWRYRIRNRDVGWLAAGIGVLAVQGILYLYWSFAGAALLLGFVTAYVVLRFLAAYTDHLQKEPDAIRTLRAAAGEVKWRAAALVIGVNALVGGLEPQTAHWFSRAADLFSSQGESSISEMIGIGPMDILEYGALLIPLVAGIYMAWRKRHDATILFACWFLSLLVVSLFARRALVYAIPAACFLSGAGLAFLWDWHGRGQLQGLRKAAFAVLVLLVVLFSLTSYDFGSDPRVSPDDDWQNALAYLREKTPEDSVVVTQWSWGYWILDLGQRRPLVDNGYYGAPSTTLHDIGVAYATTDPSEAAKVMEEHRAQYLVFSAHDLDVARIILDWAELGDEYTSFPDESLVIRSLNGSFDSGGGLEVVHRSVPDAEVVIIGLARTGTAI